MAIGDDFAIAVDGDITHVSGSTNYTVLAFHRWLQDLADDAAASGDDNMDITESTPSDRATDNLVTLLLPYNIDDDAAENLYDGSIVQKNGDEIYDGLLVLAPAGTHLEIVQNGALITPNFWTTTYNPDATNGISHRFLVKVRTAGVDVDGRRLITQTREFGDVYSEFVINGTARGNNVSALSGGNDLNNDTAIGTVAGWTTIDNTTEGYVTLDVDNDTTPEPYYSEWNKDTFTINQFTERMKWLTRRGSGSTIYGLNGELFRGITHEITVDTPTGTFNAFEEVTWTGGTGQMLAINSPTAATSMWIQLRTGVIPTDGLTITGTTSSATVDMDTTIVARTLSQPFFGQSTGSAIVGSYGFGMELTDIVAADKFTDLDDVLRVPPNNVTFTVSGLISGEDRVLVAPLGARFAYDNEAGGPFTLGETITYSGGTAYLSYLLDQGATGYMTIRLLTGVLPADDTALTGGSSSATADVNGSVFNSEDTRQLKLATTLSSGTETAVVSVDTIPTDTPATGDIRIQLDTGKYREVAYTSFTGSTFTIASTDFTGINVATGGAAEAGNSMFISYLDLLAVATTAAFTSVYNVDRNLFIRVRDGGTAGDNEGIKTFESTGVLSSTGGSSTAIRTSDV